MSKRIVISGGVIQREKRTSPAGSATAMPASSRSSRTAARRCAASPSPSPASTAPPGKTHTPAMKRARSVRRTSSTSSDRVPPRSRMIVAAWRGTVGSPPMLSSSSGGGRSICTP